MRFEGGRLGETFCASRALVGSLASVRSKVTIQARGLVEALVANLTKMGPLQKGRTIVK